LAKRRFGHFKNVQNEILKILLGKKNNFSVGQRLKIQKLEFRAL